MLKKLPTLLIIRSNVWAPQLPVALKAPLRTGLYIYVIDCLAVLMVCISGGSVACIPFVFTCETSASCLGLRRGLSVLVSVIILLLATDGLTPMLTGPCRRWVNRMRVLLIRWACLLT